MQRYFIHPTYDQIAKFSKEVADWIQKQQTKGGIGAVKSLKIHADDTVEVVVIYNPKKRFKVPNFIDNITMYHVDKTASIRFKHYETKV